MAQGEGCDTCSSNAAFQVALCYLIGFGVRPDRQESDRWLHRSTRTLDEMEDTLRRIRQAELKAKALESLTQLGYSGMLDTTYQRDGVLHEAIQQYQEMIKAQENLLGRTHFSPIRLRSLLITLMRYGDGDQNLEALNLAQSNLKIAEDRNVDQVDLLGMKSQTARIYLDLGYLETAESIAREIDHHYATGPHKDHINNLKNQEFLAYVLQKREKFSEAIDLGQKVEIACVSKLGIYHDSTLRAKRSLVEAYEGIGELEKAVELNENLVESREECTAADNPVLIEDISKLGVQYMLLKNHNAAEECYQKIATLVEENIKNAAPAMISANNCAAKLIKRGELEKSVEILEILIAKFETTLRPETSELIMMVGNLAAAYQLLEEWGRAEPLERRVWEARRRLLSSGHPHTITALRNLAANLIRQNRFGEAATLHQEEITILESLPGIEDQEKLAAVSEVVRCLMSTEDWAGAVPFLEKELVVDPESLSGRVLLATCYMKLGNPAKARPMILAFLERLERGTQGSPHTIISQAIDLAAACQERGRLVEEEQVLVIGALLSKHLDSSQSELRQQVVAKVRDLLRRRGNEEEGLLFKPSRIRDLIQKDEDGE
jgi:tetratricopeptide (TPR) repeat protein